MAEIPAALVRELRRKTNAGMMDCKKALAETAGDMESAVDWLRKAGIAAAAQKAGRATAEGLVGVASTDHRAAMVEVSAETDFLARHEAFQQFVRTLSELTLTTTGNLSEVQNLVYPGTGRTVSEELTYMVATTGENIRLCRTCVLSVGDGVVASYVHNSAAPALGKIGAIVALESSTGDKNGLGDVGRYVAMHIAATSPQFLDIASIDTTALARERDILTAQARASGKPENIIAKIVEGRLYKYYQDVVLLEQVYVIDGESRIAKVLETASASLGAQIHIAGFSRFSLGDREKKHFSPVVPEGLQGSK